MIVAAIAKLKLEPSFVEDIEAILSKWNSEYPGESGD